LGSLEELTTEKHGMGWRQIVAFGARAAAWRMAAPSPQPRKRETGVALAA